MSVLSPLFQSAKQSRDTPSLSEELPYHRFDERKHLFLNTTSLGMGLEFMPLTGAGDSDVEALNKLLCMLPEGKAWFYQIEMVMDHRVGDAIDINVNANTQGTDSPLTQFFAENEATYARYGARHSFDSNYKGLCKFDLRRFTGRIWVSTTTNNKTQLFDTMDSLRLGLNQLGMKTRPCDDITLTRAVRDTLHFDPDTLTDPKIELADFESLASQVTLPQGEMLIRDNSIAYRFPNEQGERVEGALVTLGMHKLPMKYTLANLPNCLADMKNTAISVTCPLSIHLAFTLHDSGSTALKNERKVSSLEKWTNSPMGKMMPQASEELDDRKLLQAGLRREECKLASCALTVVLKTNNDDRKRDILAAQAAFATTELTLTPNHSVHAPALFNTLPFLPADGFFNDVSTLKLVRTLKTSNLVNFCPLLADPARYQPGLMLPSYRRTLYYFDPFEAGGDNFNVAIAAASGSGKSFFTQALAKNQLSRGGHVWILDNGDSYKKFTLQEQGVYLNHADIALNPFTHLTTIAQGGEFVDDDGETVNPLKQTIGDIVSLFAILCSPNQGVTDHQRTALTVAIVKTYEERGDKALIDDVARHLSVLAEEQDNDRRIFDLAFALRPYCQDGIFGELFNKPSMLDPNAHLTTLELSGFKGDVLRPVVFALMININQAMYLSGDRTKPKVCIIEEAWKLMNGKDPAASEFIEEGYRTARKFRGSFVTVTQGVSDFFKSSASEAAYNNSDVHLYLRQGEAFANYVKENPNAFTDQEVELIDQFPTAKNAGFSSLMLKIGGRTSFHRFFCDPYARALYSTESVEFTHVENQLKRGVPIDEAVLHTANTFYAKDIAHFESIKASVKREEPHQPEEPSL
ncbi:type IV secretion system protein TraC [Vibrio mediterranei]